MRGTIAGVVDAGAAGIDSVRCVLDLRFSTFASRFSLARVILLKAAVFDTVRFADVADFRETDFKGWTSYDGATFSDSARFGWSHFAAGIGSRGARFEEEAHFADSHFGGIANFGGAEFARRAVFETTEFGKWVNFMNAVFHGDVSFRFSAFHAWINLDRALFESALDVRSTTFTVANLRGARIHAARLLLNDAIYDKMLLDDWSQVRDNIYHVQGSEQSGFDSVAVAEAADVGEVAQVFIPLQSNFRRLGQYADELTCFYDLKNIERRNSYTQLSWSPVSWLDALSQTLLWVSCGYGVRPQYTLLLAFAIVVMSAAVFYQPGAISERGAPDPGASGWRQYRPHAATGKACSRALEPPAGRFLLQPQHLQHRRLRRLVSQ